MEINKIIVKQIVIVFLGKDRVLWSTWTHDTYAVAINTTQNDPFLIQE